VRGGRERVDDVEDVGRRAERHPRSEREHAATGDPRSSPAERGDDPAGREQDDEEVRRGREGSSRRKEGKIADHHTDSTGWLAYRRTYSAAFPSTSPGSPETGSRGTTMKSDSSSSAVSRTTLPG